MITDVERGKRAIKIFYDFWKVYPEASKFSYEDLLRMLTSRRPMGGDAFLDGLGLGIREAGMSDSRVTAAMRNLALSSRGKLPAANMDFFNYLMNEATKINFVDAAIYVTTESAKDVVSGAQAVGDSIITSAKVLNFFLPLVILFFVFIYLDSASQGKMSKALGKLKA